jgi:hypothetical protein
LGRRPPEKLADRGDAPRGKDLVVGEFGDCGGVGKSKKSCLLMAERGRVGCVVGDGAGESIDSRNCLTS